MKAVHLLAPAALAFVASPALGQDVGTNIPDEIDLQGFSQIPVSSYADLTGRAVLLEFFAYW